MTASTEHDQQEEVWILRVYRDRLHWMPASQPDREPGVVYRVPKSDVRDSVNALAVNRIAEIQKNVATKRCVLTPQLEAAIAYWGRVHENMVAGIAVLPEVEVPK